MLSFTISDDMINRFANYCEKAGFDRDEPEIKKSAPYLKVQLKALMGRTLLGNEAYYPISQQNDRMINKALEVLKK